MDTPRVAPNHGDDVVTLAPVRHFLKRYRPYLVSGLSGILLFGFFLIGSVWWLSPIIRIASIQLDLNFLGAQVGKYPNDLPFSPEELINPAVLRVVFERHQLQQWIEFPAFESSLSISQSSETLKDIIREYSASLDDSKLAGPDRRALEEEYRSRLRSASSNLFTLAWFDAGRTAQVPAEIKALVLADIPAIWAEQATHAKQVLIFSSRLPGLNPQEGDGDQSGLEDYAAILSRAQAMEVGLVSMEKFPGALQVALPDGTTLIDLKLRLRAFLEQTMPAVQEALLTRVGSERDSRQLGHSLELQLKFRENRAQTSKDRLLGLAACYRDYLAGRPGAAGLTETGEPLAGVRQNENFLDRLLTLAQAGADRDYLKKMLEEIEEARIQAARDELAVIELRKNIERVRAPLARRISERIPGAPLQLPPPQEDRATRGLVMNLKDSAAQLGSLLDSSRQLVIAISQGSLGHSSDLFTTSRGFQIRETRPMGIVSLGLAFVAWGVLSSFVLGMLLLFHHRMTSLSRRILRP